MSLRFEHFRFSLLPRAQGEMFDAGADEISREQWLRRVFSESIPFEKRRSEFYYVPESEQSAEFIVGRIGRHVFRQENRPPEQGLEDFTHDTWEAALIVLDPTEHTDGQKLAIQVDRDVGIPRNLAKHLVETINGVYPRGPYQIEVSEIIDTESFWSFVEENRGSVTHVRFEFIAPNMLGGEGEFKDEMRKFREEEEARRVELGIYNEDGLDAETERMRRAVDYAERGGGSIKARARGNRRYNSKKQVKSVEIDDVPEKGEGLARRAIELGKRILGRE